MSPHWSSILEALLLVLLANGLPALLGLLLGPARPLDLGLRLADGRPLLGPSKTWRGLGASLAGTSAAAAALGLHWTLGLKVAAGAMLGDLLASFAKRRMGRPSHDSVPLLDQVPEALIPGVLAMEALALSWRDLWIAVLAFALLDLLLTPLGVSIFRRWGRLRRGAARGS